MTPYFTARVCGVGVDTWSGLAVGGNPLDGEATQTTGVRVQALFGQPEPPAEPKVVRVQARAADTTAAGSLAVYAGATPAAYRAAPAAQQLRMRARVDRELAKRAQANQIVGAAKAAAARSANGSGSAAAASPAAHPEQGRSRRAARIVRPRLTARAAFRRAATADPE